jgi:hypothetical protein
MWQHVRRATNKQKASQNIVSCFVMKWTWFNIWKERVSIYQGVKQKKFQRFLLGSSSFTNLIFVCSVFWTFGTLFL